MDSFLFMLRTSTWPFSGHRVRAGYGTWSPFWKIVLPVHKKLVLILSNSCSFLTNFYHFLQLCHLNHLMVQQWRNSAWLSKWLRTEEAGCCNSILLFRQVWGWIAWLLQLLSYTRNSTYVISCVYAWKTKQNKRSDPECHPYYTLTCRINRGGDVYLFWLFETPPAPY